jgi:hypothetical protein
MTTAVALGSSPQARASARDHYGQITRNPSRTLPIDDALTGLAHLPSLLGVEK